MKNEVSAVELNLVGKQFDGHTVFENVHLSIPRGSITGIIGPNGIGKSILLRLICGLVKPSRGQVHVFGQRVGIDVDFPDKTGALIDMPGFIPEWSAYKNLKMLADISGQADKTRIQGSAGDHRVGKRQSPACAQLLGWYAQKAGYRAGHPGTTRFAVVGRTHRLDRPERMESHL